MAIADNMPNDRPGDVQRRIADLERAVRELRAARNLDQATISAESGLGIRTADFDGTDFAHPGTTGNYFGGDGLVANAVYFRPGSISNDTLSNPVLPGVIAGAADNFAVPLSATTIIELVVDTPSGYTKALVQGVGQVTAWNPTATDDYLDAGLYMTGETVATHFMSRAYVPASTQNSAIDNRAVLLEDVGASITLTLKAETAFGAWSADSINVADITATVLWLR